MIFSKLDLKNGTKHKEKNIKDVEMIVDGENLQIDIRYRKNDKGQKVVTYIYDREKKRYYRFVDDAFLGNKTFKLRISESHFYSIFELYLRKRQP